MTSVPRQSDAAQRALAAWGIVSVIGDYRGAVIHTEVIVRGAVVRRSPETNGDVDVDATVTHVKRRHAFTVECLDCGAAPHVSPDDGVVAVCLRCGRDRWL